MRTYVLTTGGLFGLLTVVHLWRMIQEGHGLAADPWYLLITAAAASLCLWAFVVARRPSRP